MAKRKSKTTQIAISKAPRADLEVLLRPVPVTMADVRAEHATLREGHRALVTDVFGEMADTLKSARADLADMNARLEEAGR